MTKKILFLSLFISVSAYSKGGFECSDGNNCVTKDGVETCRDHKNTIRRKAVVKDNAFNGLWECFDESGKLIESREYKNDKLNGATKRLNKDLNKFDEANYKDDVQDGKAVVLNTRFSNGKHSLSSTVISHYKMGNKHGFQITLDENGKETKKVCWHEDNYKPNNPELCGGEKHAEEKPVKKEDPNQGWKTKNFKSGKLKLKFLLEGFGNYQEFYSFFENGGPEFSYKRTTKGKDFKPDVYAYSQHDDRGRELAKGECVQAATDEFYGTECYRLTGTRFSYDDSGKLIGKASYDKGKLDGDHWSLNESGDQETVTTYAKGIKTRMITKKVSDKSIVKDESYYEDGSLKK